MFKLGALLLAIASSLMISVTITQAEDCVYEADFRLLFENDPRIVGYVEYCFNHTWRGVCRESWGAWEVEEGTVACRQLGYSDQQQNVVAGTDCNRPASYFVRLDCEDGRESNLQECGVMAVDDCNCPTYASFTVYSRLLCNKNCTDNETRLVGGFTDREGRVEVCVDGRWGTVQTEQPREIAGLVCHNHSDSLVLDFYSTSSCLVSQFGYSTSKPVYSCSLVENDGDSTLSCTSTSSNNHSTDLGVLCQPPPDPTQEGVPCRDDGTLRLTNGMSHREGRVEVCVDGRWGTVCNNSQEGIAGAVCSQLGFPSDGAVITTPVANDWTRSYSCVVGGSEGGVNCMETCCDHPTSLAVKCLTHQEVVIREVMSCSVGQENRLRLVNGTTYSEGRVEVCKNGSWRSVCDNGQVEVRGRVCSALGFSKQNPQEKWFGAGEGGVSCRLTNNAEMSCEPCDSCCNDTIGVVCQTNQQYIQQINETLNTAPPSTMCMSGGSSETPSSNDNAVSEIVTPLGAVVGVLVAVLVATVVGWTVTCAVLKRQNIAPKPSSTDPYTEKNESYSLHKLPKLTHLDTSSHDQGPTYDVIATSNEGLDTYDVIDPKTDTSPANPTPVSDEANKKGDDFYDAMILSGGDEKTSEDHEGEEPQAYDVVVH